MVHPAEITSAQQRQESLAPPPQAQISDFGAFVHGNLVAMILLCMLNIPAHLELLVNLDVRLLTNQKLIWTWSLFFAVVLLFTTHKKKISWPVGTIILSFFLVSLFVSTYQALDVVASAITSIRYVGIFLFFIWISVFIGSHADLEKIMRWVVLGIALFMVTGFVLNYIYPNFWLVARGDGTGGYLTSQRNIVQRLAIYNFNVNFVATNAATGLILSAYFFAITNQRAKRYLLWGGLVVGFALMLLATLSRTSIVSLFLSFLLVTFIFKISKKHILVICALLVVTAMVSGYAGLIVERLLRGVVSLTGMEYQTGIAADQSYNRLELLSYAINGIIERPLFGWGFLSWDNLISFYPVRFESATHVTYVRDTLMWGLCGEALYLGFMFTILVKLVKVTKRMRSLKNHWSYLGVFLTLALLFNILRGMFSPMLYDFWAILGFSSAYILAARHLSYDVPKESPPALGA